MVKRVQTFIKGFDKLVEGGFPVGSCILINGAPGCGKSIFGMQYIYNGVTKAKEAGLYLTFDETAESLKEQANAFGMNMNLNKIIFERISPYNSEVISKIIDSIKKKIDSNNIKRLVLDSLPALYINNDVGNENQPHSNRMFVYQLIDKIHQLGCTILIIGESPEKPITEDVTALAEYVCDGIVQLSLEPTGGEEPRAIRVKKMRKTKLDTDLYSFKFGKNGIEVLTH